MRIVINPITHYFISHSTHSSFTLVTCGVFFSSSNETSILVITSCRAIETSEEKRKIHVAVSSFQGNVTFREITLQTVNDVPHSLCYRYADGSVTTITWYFSKSNYGSYCFLVTKVKLYETQGKQLLLETGIFLVKQFSFPTSFWPPLECSSLIISEYIRWQGC